MSLPLILFFVSLAGITILIGKKLVLLKKAQNQNIIIEENSFKMPDIEEVRHVTTKHIRKFGYVALVITIRSYIRSSNFLKKTGKQVYEKAKDRFNKSKDRFIGDSKDKREVSKFLKMISEYKHKINKIKHKIKEEENKE
jgi:hypothetical protein